MTESDRVEASETELLESGHAIKARALELVSLIVSKEKRRKRKTSAEYGELHFLTRVKLDADLECDRHEARCEEAQCGGLVGRGQDTDQLLARVLSQHYEEDAELPRHHSRSVLLTRLVCASLTLTCVKQRTARPPL